MIEISKYQRLKVQIQGSEEYLEEIRGSRERKIRELGELQVTHNNIEANEKSYLEGQIEYLEQEEQRIDEKIESLEEQLSEEDEPAETDEPIEASTYKAGKLGVTKDLASIGLSWKDISELCDEYDALIEEASGEIDETDEKISEEELVDEEFEDESEVADE